METTIGTSVQQVNPYSSPSANQKNSSEKATDALDEAKAAKNNGSEGESSSEKTDTVLLSSTRFIVSQANQASSETEIEDIDQVAQTIHEVKQWLESEYASSQAAQVHQLNTGSLVEILS
jgi:electron transfer flavoprotein alpha subunit